MLVINRREGEKINIGTEGEIVITLLGREGGQTKIGIEAPPEVPVHRREVFLRIVGERAAGRAVPAQVHRARRQKARKGAA